MINRGLREASESAGYGADPSAVEMLRLGAPLARAGRGTLVVGADEFGPVAGEGEVSCARRDEARIPDTTVSGRVILLVEGVGKVRQMLAAAIIRCGVDRDVGAVTAVQSSAVGGRVGWT
jgi:hypothetical protein